ncbi:hypothetical protein V6N11_010189 [Hibiscus sabdariffa]|uniref:RNase H type-1 domain-containing protein n=1 Tax=Hibiscus sabdariffa TaxID=183260 RepID=A0ABR2PDZ4_9ROSI
MDPGFVEHGDLLVKGLRLVEDFRSIAAGRGAVGRGAAGVRLACRGEALGHGWSLPRHGWVKVNADGASALNSGQAAAEGVIRDENGAWLFGALPGNTIVEDIREMLSRNWVVRISRFSRNSNKVANALAISIRDEPVGVRFFDIASLFVSKLLYEDVHGRSGFSGGYVS